MGLLDVFDTDAYSMHSLTVAIDKLPYMPGRIGELNLFDFKPITTRHAVIEERQGRLSLLTQQARGSQGQTTPVGYPTRKTRSFVVPHWPQWDAVLAEDLEGKRAFGTETQEEVFSSIFNDRLQAMKNNHELTWEYHRLGALNGILLDGDGSTQIYNYFTEFGISQVNAVVDFSDSGTYALPNPTIDLKMVAANVIRQTQIALGNTPFNGVRAFCGNNFWDSFIHHGTVRKAYEYYQDNSFARSLQIPGTSGGGGFNFAEITWENYRSAALTGTMAFQNTNNCFFFPTGCKDVYLDACAPADFMETVNTRGQPIYVKQERMKFDKGLEVHTQSNRLYVCTRPGCLIKGTGSNLTTEPTVS
jgi:hypothetical protein